MDGSESAHASLGGDFVVDCGAPGLVPFSYTMVMYPKSLGITGKLLALLSLAPVCVWS